MSELERRFLGQLTTPEAISTVWDLGVRPEIFQEPICATIYDFIIKYWQAEQQRLAPTPMVIAQQFAGVVLPVDQELSVHWLAKSIKDAYASTNIQETMMEVAAITVTDPEGAVKLLRDRAHHIAETLTPRHSRANMATDVEDRRRRYLEREPGDDGRVAGATLGIPELDAITNGLQNGELAVIGAYSKTGKTMLLALIAVAARRAGYTPVFFTLEMTKEEIEDRLDAMLSGISYDRLSKSKLTIDELAALHRLQEEFAALGDLFVEQPDDADRTVPALVNRARHIGANYLIIDQLSFMEPTRKVKDLKEHHTAIMRELKVEIGRGSVGRMPCALAVQFNRDSQRRNEGIGLDSFANSTDVEATCDFAIGLYRNQEMVTNRTMLAEILGGRRSKRKKMLLYWDLEDTTTIRFLENAP